MSGITITDPWRQRVDSGDWEAITAEVNSLGGALLPELLTLGEAEQIRGLYEHEWLRMCHDAGQDRPTAILLRCRWGWRGICDWRGTRETDPDLRGDQRGLPRRRHEHLTRRHLR